MAEEQKKKKGGYEIYLVVGLVIAIISVIFTLANTDPVPVDLLFRKVDIPMVLVLFLSVAIGVVLTLVFSLPGVFRRRSEVKALRKENKKLAEDIRILERSRRSTREEQPEKDTFPES